MEVVGQLLTLVAMVLWGGAGFREWRKVSCLDPTYLDGASRTHALPPEWPAVMDATQLEGFEGRAGLVQWRWESARGRIVFGRTYTIGRGERGWAVGRVEPGASELQWRPTGDSLLGGFLLIGVLGVVGVVIAEGEWIGLLGIPVWAVFIAGMRVAMIVNGRWTLERALLPQLTRALQYHLEGAEAVES